MANRKLRIALIGSGFMGRAHSNAYSQVSHFFDLPFEIEQTVICARDRTRVENMAAAWGWKEAATDWRAVVERKDIDLVDVATPNVIHAEMAIAAACAGKMVACEKPLAMSGGEAARMVEAARNVPSMVWYNYRRVPAVALARQLVEEDRIGRVFHYRATYMQQSGNDSTRPPSWKTEKAVAGSGAIGDLLSHVTDLALYLNGQVTEVTSLAKTFTPSRDVDDACVVLARFENGSIGSLEATKFGVGFSNRNGFEIHGSKGMLRFNLEDMNRLEYFDATEALHTRGARNILTTGPDHPYWKNFWKPGHIVGYEHTFIAALGDFLNAAAHGNPFHPNFEDGLRVERVLDAVKRSAESGAWTRPEA